ACHSEARCWPKNLPRCLGLNCCLLALRPILFLLEVEFQAQLRRHWVPRESALLAAFKSEAFREILRPTSGLRMTSLYRGLRMTVFGKKGLRMTASEKRGQTILHLPEKIMN